MGQIGCSVVGTQQCKMGNNPEDLSFHPYRGGSHKSRKVILTQWIINKHFKA